MAQSKSATKECPLGEECIVTYNETLLEHHNQAYALVIALVHAIKQSKENTWITFNEELRSCSQSLLRKIESRVTDDRTILSLRALVHIFHHMI